MADPLADDAPEISELEQLERDGRQGRNLVRPFIFAIVLVAVVIALVFAVTRPWESSETNQRDIPPNEVPTRPR